jgi:hypothetical protein
MDDYHSYGPQHKQHTTLKHPPPGCHLLFAKFGSTSMIPGNTDATPTLVLAKKIAAVEHYYTLHPKFTNYTTFNHKQHMLTNIYLKLQYKNSLHYQHIHSNAGCLQQIYGSKQSIKRQKVYNQQQLQPIRNFFQRVISPTIRRSRQPTQQPQPIDTSIQQPNQCDIITTHIPVIPPPQQVTTKPRYNTRSILTFFQKLTHPNTPPTIPIPKSDYRPP